MGALGVREVERTPRERESTSSERRVGAVRWREKEERESRRAVRSEGTASSKACRVRRIARSVSSLFGENKEGR